MFFPFLFGIGQIIRHQSKTCIYVEVDLILEGVSWAHREEMLHVLFCRNLRIDINKICIFVSNLICLLILLFYVIINIQENINRVKKPMCMAELG